MLESRLIVESSDADNYPRRSFHDDEGKAAASPRRTNGTGFM